MLAHPSACPTHPSCPRQAWFLVSLISQGKAWGHTLATSSALIWSQRQVTRRAYQAASCLAFTRLGTSHLLVGALRAEPRCAEQRWVGERGGQDEAPSLLLPGSHCSLGAAGSCGSSRPEAGQLPTLSHRQVQEVLLGQTTALQSTISVCGGQGHRNPEGDSRLALGSSRTSLELCGTPPVAEDPAQTAAPPSDTGQPSEHSSCGFAGPPGTPLWSPHAPWPAASGLCLLAEQPLARPLSSPSVAGEQRPSAMVAAPLGCCYWWRSWPLGLGQPEA